MQLSSAQPPQLYVAVLVLREDRGNKAMKPLNEPWRAALIIITFAQDIQGWSQGLDWAMNSLNW